MSINITLGQINIKYGDIATNLEHVNSIAKDLPTGTIFLLPELWNTGYDLSNTPYYCKENIQTIIELSKTAQRSSIFIGGSILEDINGKVYNSYNLISPQGEIVARYQKIHLFNRMDEHLWMKPGQNPVIHEFGECKTGLSICYDLRFPELFRYYAARECKLILISAEWPIRRINHWRTLLQARAIENQCFIAAVGCVGQIGDAVYGGNSMIIDPWGRILAEGSQTEEQILSVDIDLAIADEFRKKITALDDRRPDLYSAWE